jgi:hypothetical protein
MDHQSTVGICHCQSYSLLGKMLLSKKAHEKSLTSIEQSLMAGPNCQAGQGKDGAAANLGQTWLL